MSDEDTRQRILDAAEECLLEAGLTARVHYAIAERAGVSRPTVYKHAGDQAAILTALLDREVARFLTAARPVLARPGSPRDRFVEGVVFTVTYARDHTLLQKMLREEPQLVLPWLTTEAAPLIERAQDVATPYIEPATGTTRAGPDGEPGTNPAVIVEWAARLAVSLITTPSATVRLDQPHELRHHVTALFDIGHDATPTPRQAAGQPS